MGVVHGGYADRKETCHQWRQWPEEAWLQAPDGRRPPWMAVDQGLEEPTINDGD
jgi:hypothetical protein